ncbi:hypothetical protein KKH27_11450 [bacterium]|nr:hypothetical protein [bacterium]MBU1984115.1 hypothetical protein [bacterium]
MRIPVVMLSVLLAAVCLAYQPVPVQKSRVEQEIKVRLEALTDDSAKVAVAQQYLEEFPNDIAVVRAALDVLLKKMDDPITFFRQRLEMDTGSIAAHYLYGKASRDSTIMAEAARWILTREPDNYWGHELAGYAEWFKANPDTGILIRNFRKAIEADPSRPEGYLYLGWVFWDEELWPEAREVLEAGAIVDPEDKSIRDARLTVYAEQRDGKTFFDLMQGVFSDTPLIADLPRAKAGPNVTTADLRGQPTVIEYWAYT